MTMTVFCNLIGMALQNKMPWGMLANTLDCIIPSFEESKQVIIILLKELENLQVRLMEKERDEIENTKEQVHETDGFLPETETIEDDIEVLGVVKERIDEEIFLKLDNQTNSFDAREADQVMTEINDHKLENEIVNQTTSEIDNERYTFETNDHLLGMLRVATGRVGSGSSKFSTGRVGSGQQI